MRVGDLSLSDPGKLWTAGRVKMWLDQARPGSRLTYHYGFLARDRVWRAGGKPWDARRTRPDVDPPPAEWERVENVANIAEMVEAAQKDGIVSLHQRRIAPMYWEYQAIKLK